MKTAEEYKVYHHEKPNKFNSYGFGTVRLLPHLTGKPWNNLVLGALEAFRPSNIRVSTGMFTADSCCWRISVIVDDDNNIVEIVQEVKYGIYGTTREETMENWRPTGDLLK